MWRVHCRLVAAAAETAAAGGSGGAAGVEVDAAQADGWDYIAITHHLQFSRSVSFVHGAEFVSTSPHPVVSYGCNTTSHIIRKSKKEKNTERIRSPTANSPSRLSLILILALSLSHSLLSFCSTTIAVAALFTFPSPLL